MSLLLWFVGGWFFLGLSSILLAWLDSVYDLGLEEEEAPTLKEIPLLFLVVFLGPVSFVVITWSWFAGLYEPFHRYMRGIGKTKLRKSKSDRRRERAERAAWE